MGIDVYLTKVVTEEKEIFAWSCTHNLIEMAEEAGLYEYLWKPDNLGIKKARDLIAPLTEGLNILKSYPDRFKKFNPSNGFGSYDGFINFVCNYLNACKEEPDSNVNVWR